MNNATITGTVSWPAIGDYTYVAPAPATNQTAEFAKAIIQGLLTHDAHLLLSEAELCDKAWRLAKEMRNAAARNGEWI